MKIAVDVSPLESGHKVRGVGFYLKNLKEALVEYFPDNNYTFFTQENQIPKSIDVIHYPYFDPFFLTLPLKNNAKTVVTVHDLTPLVFPQAFPAGLKGNIRWQVQKLALKRADRVITDSEASKKDVIRLVGIPEERVHVVYLAAGGEFKKLEIGNWKLEITEKYEIPMNFILYVGDVTWNKNLPRLLDAIAGTDIPLIMVGKAITENDFDRTNPWNADRIKLKEKADKNQNVFRLGFLPTEDIVKLYNAATAFVFPSLYEGFGLPVLEAMSCGTPVITTRNGSLHEVAGQAAYYINAEDTDDIAKGIKDVFNNNRLREKLSEDGLRQSARFSWRNTAEETVRVYEFAVQDS